MLKTGKLDSEVLKRIIFDNIKFKRDEIITRPGIGEDCAEIDFGEYVCVMSTDPITASVSDIVQSFSLSGRSRQRRHQPGYFC